MAIADYVASARARTYGEASGRSFGALGERCLALERVEFDSVEATDDAWDGLYAMLDQHRAAARTMAGWRAGRAWRPSGGVLRLAGC